MSSANPDENAPSQPTSTKPATRGKTDPAWGHCTQEAKIIICGYCTNKFKGGGINRFKKHLAGVRGDCEPCKKVPADVRYQMQQSLGDFANKRKKPNDVDDDDQPFEEENVEVQEVVHLSTPSSSKRKSSATRGQPSSGTRLSVGDYFMPRTTPGAQPSIRSVLQSKDAKEKVDLAISKWLIDAGVAFNAVNSKYYQPMLDAVASFGPGYRGPSMYDIRGFFLEKNVQEVKKFVEGFRDIWRETGCTVMADGWTDQKRRTLINFLVQCPKGTVFLKSVDATDVSKTAEVLFKLFKSVVEFVGPDNVVHMVTDNARNYVTAGKLLEREFPTLYWSPCAAHCINLMLSDMGKLEEVVVTVGKASDITKYVYNHCYPLHLMRKFTRGREILRPAPTRFATNFIALQSLFAQKDCLRDMVTSNEWVTSKCAKETKGKKFKDNVLDPQFWKNCATICKITEPLVRVLRIVDSDARPAMGYLYGAMSVAKEEIMKRFQRRRRVAEPYIQIIDARWDAQLGKDIHAAGFWFNPSNQYNPSLMAKHRRTSSGVLDVIERYAHGRLGLQTELTSELRLFRNAEGDFGRVTAIRNRSMMLPDEWWLTYGNSTPNLQKLAVRILGQTCSASGCERNWSIFEFIHTKKRNRLEHQRLNDLVYVRYNLRLHERISLRGRNYDPINFEDFVDNDTWVLEDDPPLLTTDELEDFRQQMARLEIENNANDEDLNLDDLNFEDEDEEQHVVINTSTSHVNDDTGHEEALGDAVANDHTSQENIVVHHWTFG